MSTRDAKGDGEMKRFVFLTMIALAIVLSPAQVTVFAQTCPVNTVRQFARVEAVESLEIVQADQTIEVADEWLNGCSGPPSAQTYTSQVMWIIDPPTGQSTTTRWLEVGIRKRCDISQSVELRPYWSTGVLNGGVGSAFPAPFKNGTSDVSVDPATRVDVHVKKLGFADPNHAQSLWQFEVSINGTTFASRPQVMPGSFSPNVIRVGGENMSDLHDMGVSGHLNTRYLLENGANLDLTFLADRTVNKLEDPRYFIDKGSGGFGDSEYFQTTTDIHHNDPTPTEVPEGFDMCDGE